MGAVAIAVESALPFSVFSCVYLVVYLARREISDAFLFYVMFTVRPLVEESIRTTTNAEGRSAYPLL